MALAAICHRFFVHIPITICQRWCLVAALVLSGCASQESPIAATFSHIAHGTLLSPKDTTPPTLDKRYRYLRVQYNQLPAVYMVLGYLDSQDTQSVETWYSADGEVIQLREGRIVGTAGLPYDWAHVKLSALPNWGELANGQPMAYTRQRDSRVGYAYNVTDHIEVVRPSGTSAALQFPATAPRLPDTAWWVQETTSALPAAYVAVLPTANGPTWVYSYQCLTPQVCLSMQPWPPAFSYGP